MADRTPLVLIDGRPSLLPDGDRIELARLSEYVDADPPAPNVGAQWVRLSTVAPARCPTHLAPLGLIGNRLTVQRKAELKTQTSLGVI